MRRLPALSVVVVLVSAFTGIVVNVVSNAANGWLSRPWILWPLLVAACTLSIAVDVAHARRAQIDRERQWLQASERPAAQAAPAPPTRQSDAVLVDASVDDNLLVYGLRVRCAALDFKFVNRGTVSSVLHHFDVQVTSFEPDLTPVLAFSFEPHGPHRIGVSVDNFGWGAARDCRIEVTDPVLARFLPPESLATVADIGAGEHLEVLTITIDSLDQQKFDELTAKRAALRDRVTAAMKDRDASVMDSPGFAMLLSHHEKWHVQEYFDDLRPGPDGPRQRWHIEYLSQIKTRQLPVRLTLDLAYCGERENHKTGQALALRRLDQAAEGELWLTADRFRYDPQLVMFAPLTPTEAVFALLAPEPTIRRGYSVSRTIPPSDADRFHVVVAAERSGTYTVRVHFHTDAPDAIVSPPISVYLRRDRNQKLPEEPVDGASLAIDHDRLVRYKDGLLLRSPRRS